MTKGRRTLIASVAAATLAISPAFAGLIPGIPDLVIDPASIAKLAQQITQYQQMIAQELALVNTATAVYEMTKYNLEYFSFKRWWQINGILMLPSQVRNLYGETEAWGRAINGGTPAQANAAWTSATTPVKNGDFLASQTLGNSAHLATLAGIEAQDAAGQNALASIASVRGAATKNEPAIKNLEERALSTDPADNTEISQLNLLNAGTVQSIRMQQGTQSLLSELLEQQLTANLYQRNAATETLNIYTKAVEDQTARPSAWGNTATTLNDYNPR